MTEKARVKANGDEPRSVFLDCKHQIINHNIISGELRQQLSQLKRENARLRRQAVDLALQIHAFREKPWPSS
ncbi:MAG TPA: hypothetical protein VGF60_24635 [Xanthobacteraceae bacterium]